MDSRTTIGTENSECQDDLEEPLRMNKRQPLTPEEQSQEKTEPTLLSPSVAPLYYSVMDDEGSDEVFVQTPSLPSRMDPEGGSTCEAASADPCVSLRSSDATAANANPECLDWHHGERQLLTSHSQVNKEMESAITTLGEVVRTSGGIQCTGQDPNLLEDDDTQNCEGTTEESNEEIQEDQMVKLKSLEGVDPLEENGLSQAMEEPLLASQDQKDVTDDYQNKMDVTIQNNQSPDNSVEDGIDSELANDRCLDSELTGYDWVKRTSVEDVEEVISIEHRKLDDQEEATDTRQDSRIATDILQGEDLLQRLQLVQQRQDITEVYQPTQNLEVDLLTNNPARDDAEIIQEIQMQEQTEQAPEDDASELTMTATFERCTVHETSRNENYCYKESDTTRTYVNLTESSEDEEVCKNLEQDFAESTCKAKQIVKIDQPAKDWSLEDECRQTGGAVEDEQTCADENNDSNNEDHSQEVKERTCSPCLSPQQMSRKASDFENADTWMNESRIPVPLGHRLSAAETYMEKQFQEASQIKRDLQRAEGVYDLTEDPDILEIPFKTSISLDPLPTRDDPILGGDWRFSEQKMQKEISQEMQRELVLVNQGKIPGGYSKGESRQMKDTKLLFEVFQQDTVEGPARIRKPQTLLQKSQVYPSVLERTKSLEMFSLKMSPVLRTNSFRVMSPSEGEKHIETFRSQSPSLRDKARLSPYPKHEKLPRKHKSMDSINNVNSTTSVDRVRNYKQEPLRESSPILKENPFFKLRPALCLQPEVEKDIRESKKREEELRKQRSCLYRETRPVSKEEGKPTAQLKAEPKPKTTGKLECVWPPPSKKDPSKAEQQETRVQRGPGSRPALWQRWESGMINGQTPSSGSNN